MPPTLLQRCLAVTLLTLSAICVPTVALAAEDGGPIHHHHLRQASTIESEELGRVVKR